MALQSGLVISIIYWSYSEAGELTRISHHLTAEARNKPAIPTLRLLAVLNVLFKYASERRAPCNDGLLTHFASPRGEESGLSALTILARKKFRFPPRRVAP